MFGNFLSNFGLDFQIDPANAQPGGPFSEGTYGLEPGGTYDRSIGTGMLKDIHKVPGLAGYMQGNQAGMATSIDQAVPRPPGGGGQPQPTSPASFAAPQAAAPSPLGSPLAPGGGSGFQNQPASDPAPAAGVGSQFKQQGGF